jgi:L-cystine uptake protein TcyP (sodium:dicarboxylate symporter family)
MPNVDNQSSSSGTFGYLLVLILFALVFLCIIPLIGMLYVDTMVVKREAKAQMEKTEKLRKQLEEERKNVNPVLIPNQLLDGRTPKNP